MNAPPARLPAAAALTRAMLGAPFLRSTDRELAPLAVRRPDAALAAAVLRSAFFGSLGKVHPALGGNKSVKLRF